MAKWLLVLTLLFMMPVAMAASVQTPPQVLTVNSHDIFTPVSVQLTEAEWGWLGMKDDLRIGTFSPANPPLDMVPEPGIMEGIYADYIQIISRALGLDSTILRYPNRADALKALGDGSVDLLVDDAGGAETDDKFVSIPLGYNIERPVLVTKESKVSQAAPYDKAFKMAVVMDYLSDEEIARRFPHAKIMRYPSNQAAMAAVAYQAADYFYGDITTASNIIERNYTNKLAIVDVFEPAGESSRFILRKADNLLLQAVDTVLHDIPEEQHKLIVRQYSQRIDLWRFQKPLQFTEKEQRWLEANKEVKIGINPYFPPFTVFNGDDEFHGISADVLRLIHLRTGINFIPVPIDTVTGMVSDTRVGKVDMLAALSVSPTRESELEFTRSYVSTPFVLVVPESMTLPKLLSNSLTLAATPDNALVATISARFPGIKWVMADNASVLMKLVDEGKVDGAVQNQISANYLIDHYFRGKLKIAFRLGENPANVAFAVRRDQNELYSILNKALAEIQPHELSLVVNKWQGTPDVPLNTWDLYSYQFYWVVVLALGMVAASLGWGFTLRKQMRRRREAQDKLLGELTFRDSLLNGSPTPIYVIDAQFHLISHNQAFDHFFSKVDPEFLTLSMFDQRHPLSGLQPSLLPLMEGVELSNDEDHIREYTLNNGEGQRQVAHWAKPFEDIRGNTAGLICGWQDVTEYEQLLQQLSIEKEIAETANRAKSTFLATMSHEIRTPISAIIGLLELEVHKRKSREDNQGIEVAYESAQSLLGLIGDILDLAKIESGKLELTPDWVNTRQLIVPVVRVFEGVARHKQLTLTYETDNQRQLEVFIDALRFKQVISNYISNALKFTQSGGVSVRVRHQIINENNVQVKIQIKDTGVGIGYEDQKRLFQPFVQLEEGKKQTGTGLGLVISQQLLQKMNGSMELDSEPGKGTCITISMLIPVRQGVAPQPVKFVTDEAMEMLNILIVDDHPANRLLLNNQLSLLGHQVAEAHNGQQALDLLEAHSYDLVITDCDMPVMDGLTLTRRIRQFGKGNQVKIFGLTANAQAEERIRCMQAGMDECLFKPLRLSQLDAILRTLGEGLNPSTEKRTLEQLLGLEELEGIFPDREMVARMLQKIREENLDDIAQAKICLRTQDWDGLSSSMHRIGGAAQIIYATEINQLSKKLESLSVQPVNAMLVSEGINQLDALLTELSGAIGMFLEAR